MQDLQISNQTVVTLHYKVAGESGDVIDSSFGGEPLIFLQGRRFLIEGLENALEGKVIGDTFSVDIAAAQAYGERIDALCQSVPKSMFDGVEVEPGMQFRATTNQGEQSVVVMEVNDEDVVVDGNHPLAGMPLTFDVEILDVRQATETELAHGHAHGADGSKEHD